MRTLSSLSYLAEDETVQRWLRQKTNHYTRYYYLKRFEKFLEFAGPELHVKTPSEWLAWAKTHDSILVGDMIEKFTETQSRYSQRFAMAVIRSHLKRNGFRDLPTMPDPPGRKQFHPGYERQQVQELLSFLDNKWQKLYVYFAKDSGLRAADLLSIRYGHIKKDFEAKRDTVHIAFEPEFYERRKASGITFIGPNSVKLLRELADSHQLKTASDEKLFPFVYKTISFALRLAKKKAGLDLRIQPSHGLRKFFTNSLGRVGMDEDRKRQLEGHSLGVEWAYTNQNIEELRKLYQQAYQFLDLSEEAAAESRVKELERIVTEQRGKIKELESEYAAGKELREQMDRLEKRLAQIEREKQSEQ